MYSRSVALLLVVARVCFAQLDVQPYMKFLFTPRDYRMINELALADSRLTDVNYAKLNGKNGPNQEGTTKRNLNHVSQYLEPPAASSVSQYAKFFMIHSRDKQQQIDGVPKNHRPYVESKMKLPKKVTIKDPIRDHAPINQTEPESAATLENKDKVYKKSPQNNLAKGLELSPDGDRIEFQIQGHEGPKTYIFGFDTGNGKNRQFRLEERLEDGTVKGHYGYYDARGKLRTIRYLARPFEGYREKHHESPNSLTSSDELEPIKIKM